MNYNHLSSFRKLTEMLYNNIDYFLLQLEENLVPVFCDHAALLETTRMIRGTSFCLSILSCAETCDATTLMFGFKTKFQRRAFDKNNNNKLVQLKS